MKLNLKWLKRRFGKVLKLKVKCEICVETKSRKKLFNIKDCHHSYCSDCISSYVESKIQENISKINCPVPNCASALEPEYCRLILTQKVYERWGQILCESLIPGAQSFYCPFKDCSALLLDDREDGIVIRESVCPHCRRMFCARCRIPWHSEITCEEIEKLGKDEKEDILLVKLVEDSKWQRCPSCKVYVERSEGCTHMTCRCGCAFCYTCGSPLDTHSSCSRGRRSLYDERRSPVYDEAIPMEVD